MKNTSEEYHTIRISHEQSGKRFDQALTESLKKYSRSSIKKWIEKGNLFESGKNCIGVSNEYELSEFLTNDLSDEKYSEILENSRKILENHT